LGETRSSNHIFRHLIPTLHSHRRDILISFTHVLSRRTHISRVKEMEWMYIVDELAQKNDFKTIKTLKSHANIEIAERVATLIVELNPSVQQLPPENLTQLVLVNHLVIRSTGLKWIRRTELPNVDMELLTRIALGVESPQ
jgi:hypothetical protein